MSWREILDIEKKAIVLISLFPGCEHRYVLRKCYVEDDKGDARRLDTSYLNAVEKLELKASR